MKLLNKLSAIIQLPLSVSVILKQLAIQKKFLTVYIQPILKNAQQTNDGSLDASDFSKITGYYGLAVPAILGEAFCALYGKKMREDERIASTAQGAMTGLFDDFFDKAYLSGERIDQLLQNEGKSGSRSNEMLFNQFYSLALKHVPCKERMQATLMEVYNAQQMSRKQTDELISAREIEEITFYKGAVSLLFYRTAFLPMPETGEQQLVYQLGSLMQLCNDIFDVYKDSQENIQTMVTTAVKIVTLRTLLEERLFSCYADAYALGKPRRNVKKFLSILSLGIFSRAFVCLDQLEKNETTSNGRFTINSYSRKQLICDMERVSNISRSAVHAMRLQRFLK